MTERDLAIFVKAKEKSKELEAWLSTPTALSNMDVYRTKSQEYSALDEKVSIYNLYLETKNQIQDLSDLIDVENDPSFTELAKQEINELESKLDDIEHQMKMLLIPKDPNDDKNVIIEIRAGAGGEEAALFVADIYRMYSMYAMNQGFKIDPMYENETGLGGYKEIDFMLLGKGAYSKMKYESGVHRVQRIPVTESNGKLQTSTITVAVLPEVDDVSVQINPQDIKLESCKSSGAGGQHINKTESAVRLTHIPTGIVVECQQERSQLQNREKAMKMLEAKLFRIQEEERSNKIASDRKNQVGTGERSEKIRTYNYPQNRVTDHRIGLSIYHLEQFMNGDIDEMINALVADDLEKAIKGNQDI